MPANYIAALERNFFLLIAQRWVVVLPDAHVVDEFVLDAAKHLFAIPALKLIGAMHAAKWYCRTSDQCAMDRSTWADWVKRQT